MPVEMPVNAFSAPLAGTAAVGEPTPMATSERTSASAFLFPDSLKRIVISTSKISSADFGREPDRSQGLALVEPVVVTHEGSDGVVVISAETSTATAGRHVPPRPGQMAHLPRIATIHGDTHRIGLLRPRRR